MGRTKALWIVVVWVAAALALACGGEPAGVTPIAPEALLSSPPEGVVILDVRTPEEYAGGHVPGAVNIPHTEVADRLDELAGAESSPVVVYCERGGRAGMAEEVLLANGYRDVRHLEGDMRAWREAGRPTER